MPGGGTQCWTRQPSLLLRELISQLGGGGWGPFGHVIGEETDNRNWDAMVGEQKVWRWQLWTGCSPDVILQWWAMSQGLKESGSWPKRPQAEGTYKGKAPEVKSRKGTKFGCRVVGEGESAAAWHWWESRASHRVLDAKIRMLLRRGTQLQRCCSPQKPLSWSSPHYVLLSCCTSRFPLGPGLPEQWCPSPRAVDGPPSYRFLAPK